MPEHTAAPQTLAWGAHVSRTFCLRLVAIALALGIEADWLMACIAFESGRSFRPDVRNGAGSGAVGLIQFMPSTAKALGTSVEALALMSAVDQLQFVRRYFEPYAGKLKNVGDVYMAILWPAGIGKADDHVLFRRNDPKAPKRYAQNAGLDKDKDGEVTRGECIARIVALLEEGRAPQRARSLA